MNTGGGTVIPHHLARARVYLEKKRNYLKCQYSDEQNEEVTDLLRDFAELSLEYYDQALGGAVRTMGSRIRILERERSGARYMAGKVEHTANPRGYIRVPPAVKTLCWKAIRWLRRHGDWLLSRITLYKLVKQVNEGAYGDGNRMAFVTELGEAPFHVRQAVREAIRKRQARYKEK